MDTGVLFGDLPIDYVKEKDEITGGRIKVI